MNREETIRKWEEAARLQEAKKVNPYAVCTASVGRKDEAKYKRCKEKVAKGSK